MKHTKGPWHILGHAHIQSATKRMIGSTMPHPGDCPIGQIYSDEDKANARFMASSPELFEALIAVREYLLKVDALLPKDLVEKIDSAITKASTVEVKNPGDWQSNESYQEWTRRLVRGEF